MRPPSLIPALSSQSNPRQNPVTISARQKIPEPQNKIVDKEYLIRYAYTMRRDDVLSILKEQNQKLNERYGVKSLYLFGSVARDEASPESDVDLLVEFNHPVGLFKFIELQQSLESLLGCKVDLGTKRSLKLQLKDKVLQEAILVA